MINFNAHTLAQMPTSQLQAMLRDREVSCESFDVIAGILAGRATAGRPRQRHLSID